MLCANHYENLIFIGVTFRNAKNIRPNGGNRDDVITLRSRPDGCLYIRVLESKRGA